jgi:hypothetical protein
MTVKQTQLTVPEPESALAEWKGYTPAVDDGTEDVAPSFPNLRIVQATSKMEGAGRHGGDFWRSDTEEFMGSVSVVPIYRRVTRAMFAELSEKPDCSSSDGVYPNSWSTLWDEKEMEWPSSCDTCPFSGWGEDNSPPKCKESWVFLLDLDGELVQFRATGKNIKPWKALISRRLKPKHLPLYSHRVTMTNVRKQDGQNIWYETELSPVLMGIREAQRYGELLKSYRDRFTDAVSANPDEAPAHTDEWVE